MKANLALSKGLTSKKYHLVINDTYYLKISKSEFYDLAEYLEIDIKE